MAEMRSAGNRSTSPTRRLDRHPVPAINTDPDGGVAKAGIRIQAARFAKLLHEVTSKQANLTDRVNF
jgi:hypothetical protein